MVFLSKPYPFRLFKGCLPQILLGPLLNTWTHMKRKNKDAKDELEDKKTTVATEDTEVLK